MVVVVFFFFVSRLESYYGEVGYSFENKQHGVCVCVC